MKGLMVFALIVMPTVLLGYSPIYGVTHEYDSNIDFAKFEIYDWLPVKSKTGEDTMTIRRIQDVVNKNLQSKGYRQSSTSPDFIIVIFFETRQRLAEVDPFSAAYSPYTAPPARYYEEGNLVLDFIDPDDKHLIWRGSAGTDVSQIRAPEQIEKTSSAAVEKILNKFPPQ
jgi:hypothetical protein